MNHFTINFAENYDSTISIALKQKRCKDDEKNKTREKRTIFFKLKRNVKINNEAAKRV